MALARWQRTIVDNAGNILAGASVEVRDEETGALATLFSNRAGTTPQVNPVIADVDGFVGFHVIGGSYKITATSGFFTREWRYVPIGTASERDAGEFMDVGYLSPLIPNILTGLEMSNNGSDITNDIDIAAGFAADSTNFDIMILASALTKRLDGAWVVGNGNGGLDTGAVADGTYHVFAIERPDTGVVDVLFSLSATAPTMPPNYTLKRRIGSLVRLDSAIKTFYQNGDVFLWQIKEEDLTLSNRTTDVAWGLIELTVPTGIRVEPILDGSMLKTDLGTVSSNIGDGRDTAGTNQIKIMTTAFDEEQDYFNVRGGLFTDLSAQIYFSLAIFAGIVDVDINTRGYIDTRGK